MIVLRRVRVGGFVRPSRRRMVISAGVIYVKKVAIAIVVGSVM